MSLDERLADGGEVGAAVVDHHAFGWPVVPEV